MHFEKEALLTVSPRHWWIALELLGISYFIFRLIHQIPISD
ncbi:hypothetical protein [Staphylococcus nepalensis]|nr:hypothetical protein [Staphylococcus nepalensis]